MGHSSNRRKIRDTVLGITDRLKVDGPCILVDCLVEFLRVIPDNPFDVDLELAQIYPELVEAAAVYYDNGILARQAPLS